MWVVVCGWWCVGIEGEENIWCVRELGGRGRAGKAVIFNAKISNLQHPYVAVLRRSRRLFRCIFRLHRYVQSAVLLNFC